jgi:Holliday junction DNA helicase RuvA
MLAYLKGIIDAREITGGPVDKLWLDVGGVGFELCMAHSSALACGQIGDEVKLHVSVAIRETEWTIFAFATNQERQLFNLLQSVSGIGPKLALGMVGALGVETLVEAILSESPKMIAQAPGVGPKVAQKIIIDLKSKIEDFAAHLRTEPLAPVKLAAPIFEEATDILANLGYTASEIHQALKMVRDSKPGLDNAEEILRYSLKILGAGQAL